MASRSRFDKDASSGDAERGHLILLCKNNEGYKNLTKLVSLGFIEGFYNKPRIDKELLRRYSNGLIGLSACLAGEIPRAIIENNYDKARELAIEYNEIFGQGNFFLEMQSNGIDEQVLVNQGIVRLARELNIPLVATNDAHYLTKDDYYSNEVLLCIPTGKKMSDTDRLSFSTNEFYFKSAEEMKDRFKNFPEAIENTLKIADMCNVEFEFGKLKLPEFKIDTDMTHEEYFVDRCRKGIEKSNEIGRKSFKETQQNFAKGKQKIDTFKSRIKEKKAKDLKNVVNNTSKTIKSGTKKTIKTAKSSTKLTGKSIKTAERVAKNSQKVAKESVKATQRAIKITKHATKVTAKTIKATVQATIKAIKAIIVGVKALISAIVAGGWVAVVIILVIVLIAGFIATIFNSDGDMDYDSSQIPNSEIILVAKAQIGNEGGDKFWKWYGFEEHVHWCACYVSWCANECGYIDKGIIPKFSVCTDGITWFKEKNEWHDRGESYYPIVGDIIFFDWYDENGNQDGTSDHVGIVTRTDITNRNIYTIEGNTSNKCAERMYSFDDVQVMGYGSPKYE